MRPRVWISFAVLSVVVLLTLANCRGWWSPRISQSVVRPVYAWMSCQECRAGERARVVSLGDTAVPMLRTLLLDGPPSDRRQQMVRYLAPLGTAHNPPGPASPATLDEVLSDYDAMYRFRAANALGSIGGDKARRALCDAQKRQSARASVRQAIDTALYRMHGTCP